MLVMAVAVLLRFPAWALGVTVGACVAGAGVVYAWKRFRRDASQVHQYAGVDLGHEEIEEEEEGLEPMDIEMK